MCCPRLPRVWTAAWSLVAALGVFSSAVQADEHVIVLRFQERESGTEFYPVRMIVTPEYLRIDDGEDRGDFVLFDRGSETVYSVAHDNAAILVVQGRSLEATPPPQFEHREEQVELADAPDIAGRTVVLYRIFTNGDLCGEVAAVDLLPDTVAALREYQRALAAEQADVAERTPPDLQTVCDLADYVFEPDRYLRHGFPVRYRSASGRERVLESYEEDNAVAPELFTLPQDYRRFSPPAQ